MARYEFAWDESDGAIFSRRKRSVPYEAQLIMRDLDDPVAPDVVTLIRLEDPATLAGAMFIVAKAVNASLRRVEVSEPAPVA